MNETINRLELWRKERGRDASQGFEFDLNSQVSFLTEEITEYLRAKNDDDRVDALCDLTVFSLNAINGIEISSQNIDISIELLKSYKTIKELPPTVTIEER